MSVDNELMCSFQILKSADKLQAGKGSYAGRPTTPPKSKVETMSIIQ